MFDRANMKQGPIYLCDGSLPGLLCCIYESYIRRERPEAILTEDTITLFPSRHIATKRADAERVWYSIQKLGGEAPAWVRDCWLSDGDDCVQLAFDFICLLYERTSAACNMLGDELVSKVHKLVRAVRHEAHLYCGFVRFTQYDGMLAARIEPKGMVLPLLCEHFITRFPGETFLIHDATHGQALYHSHGTWAIKPVDLSAMPKPDANEQRYAAMWKAYYNAISIKERENPRCRMSHMPKRYWKYLTEFLPDIPFGAAG